MLRRSRYAKVDAGDATDMSENTCIRFNYARLCTLRKVRLQYVPQKTQNHVREAILSFYVNPILGHFGFMMYSGKLQIELPFQISANKIWIINYIKTRYVG